MPAKITFYTLAAYQERACMEEMARLKAELLSIGKVHIPPGVVLASRGSHSTAGPGVGRCSYIFSIGGTRVRLASVGRDETQFSVDELDGRLVLKRGDVVIAEDIRVEPIVYHASNQAFINLDTRCRYQCAFCDTPELSRQGKRVHRDLSDVLDMVSRAMDMGAIDGVALTTGIPSTPQESNRYVAEIVSGLKARYPEVSIGVETIVDSREELEWLRGAGADEIKINMEAATGELLEKVCPGMDRNKSLEMLRHAVDVFGRNRVASNVIFGLGETRKDLRQAFEELASIGVVPNPRQLRVTEWNRPGLERVLGHIPAPNSAEEVVELTRECADVLRASGLDPTKFRTMCLNCGACDLTPMMDVGGER